MIVDWEIARQRQAEYERAAEIERLIAASQSERPRLIHRWLVTLGDMLITAGQRLRKYAFTDTDRDVALGS